MPIPIETPWKRHASRYLYRSRWYNLRQDEVSLPSGEEIVYTVVEHPGFVVVVPLLPNGLVVMERIYRYPLEHVTLECPSGGLDGQAPEIAGRRELEEETGYRAGQWNLLGTFAGTSGIGDTLFHVFLARDLTHDGALQHENTEQLEIVTYPLDELQRMALGAEILDAPSALAILLASSRLHTQTRKVF